MICNANPYLYAPLVITDTMSLLHGFSENSLEIIATEGIASHYDCKNVNIEIRETKEL